MGRNFKFQVQDSFLEYFFSRFGDLKNESHFLKKSHLYSKKKQKKTQNSYQPAQNKQMTDKSFIKRANRKTLLEGL